MRNSTFSNSLTVCPFPIWPKSPPFSFEGQSDSASASTVCRFEKRADREVAWRMHEVMIEQFIASFKHLRQVWPKVKLVIRGDSGFCRWKLLSWCERHQVDYIIGLARIARLEKLVKPQLDQAVQAQAQSGRTIRRFTEFDYAAQTWNRSRRVIAKVQVTPMGPNPRFVVTNLGGQPRYLYDKLYCARCDGKPNQGTAAGLFLLTL